MKNRIWAAVLSAIALLGAVDAASANHATPGFTNESVGSSGLKSFHILCVMNADDCRPDGASKISLDESATTFLASANYPFDLMRHPPLDCAALQL